MYNPQMMMGGIPDVPSPKELWKDEKSKYRHWIILFGVGIFAMIALVLTGLIMTLMNIGEAKSGGTGVKGEIYEYIRSNYAGHDTAWYVDATNAWYQKKLIIYPSIKIGSLFVGAFLYIQTVVDAYRNKSFARLSNWASLVIAIVAMFGAYELFSLAWGNNKLILNFSTGLYIFISYILAIAIWVSFSVPLGRIRRLFALSERVEMIKSNPMYTEAMNNAQNMGQPMGGPGMNPFMGGMGNMAQHQVRPNPNPNGVAAQGNPQPVQKQAELSPEQKQKKELVKLTVVDLQAIAKKLSISGYSSMKKDELIEAIIRVSGGA